MMNQYWLCMLGLHDWEKWQDGQVYKHRTQNTAFGAGIIDEIPYWIDSGEFMQQTRTCFACGIKESRAVKI